LLIAKFLQRGGAGVGMRDIRDVIIQGGVGTRRGGCGRDVIVQIRFVVQGRGTYQRER
jgi:hypothetical protein